MVEALYLASTWRFVFDVTGPPGSGERVAATRFYLLSEEGRFHRGWGQPSVPDGRIAAFDFTAAESEDAYNTGTYTLSGDGIVFHPMAGEEGAGLLTAEGLLVEQLPFTLASGATQEGGPAAR